MSCRGKGLFFAVALALAAADLVSKAWAFGYVEDYGVASALHHTEKAVAVVPGFFYLTRVWNPGGIWGIAQSGALSTALVVFRALAIPALVLLALRTPAADRLLQLALALFCAGAIGNLYDNLAFERGVRDFLDFYLVGENGYHWPTFNLADAAISSGVVLVLVEMLLGRRDAPVQEKVGAGS